MRYSFLLILMLVAVVGTAIAQSEEPSDSLQTWWVDPIVVEAGGLRHGEMEILLDKGNHKEMLRRSGFALIDKGVAFTSDLYLEGFKREDIVLRIDGERLPCACANRMDNPSTRINPLEICSSMVDKTSSSAGAGLGGAVEFVRAKPSDEPSLRVLSSGEVAGDASYDAALAFDYRGYRSTARFAQGVPYEDGDGANFAELYPYAENHGYSLYELGIYGGQGDWGQGINFSRSEDVLFPYLKMDERQTDFIGLHGSWKGNRLYYNHTRHLMDNELRGGPTLMVSDAYNTTFGLSGEHYELYYRNWDTENYFDNPTAGFHIDNHLIPDIHLVALSVDRQFRPSKRSEMGARLGLQYVKMGDGDRLDFHNALHVDGEDTRFFLPFGAHAGVNTALGGDMLAGLQVELAGEPPQARDLYISVKKPGTMPWWSGNPKLDMPLRATLRGKLREGPFSFEAYGGRIWNYVNLASMMAGEQKYLSFESVDAALAGLRFVAEWTHLDIRADYTLGWNLSEDSPLAEVRPFSVETTLRAPAVVGVRSWLRHVYSDAQTRVDESLNESATPAWNRFDLGLGKAFGSLGVSLEVKNLAGEVYYEHLAYLRDPFASGMTVNAPGRTIRVALSYGR